MSGSTESGSQFLRDFFGATRSSGEEGAKFFSQTFVEPLQFAQFCGELKPVEGQRRIVVVDGHPRSGKTWLVLGAIHHMLSTQPDCFPRGSCWSAGRDCLKIPDIETMDLEKAVSASADFIAQQPDRQSWRVVLLDDILGTQKPRPLRGPSTVRSYFSSDPDVNPWLKQLPPGCTLVITGRSLFFALLETFLGQPVRAFQIDRSAPTACLRTFRWGIFRTLVEGELIGAFNLEKVAKVAENIRQVRTARNANEQQMMQSSPVVGFFLSEANAERNAEAAYLLFGEDFSTLAQFVAELRGSLLDRRWPNQNEALKELEKLYLLTLAPGLFFRTPGAADVLGIDHQFADQLFRSMYYEDKDLNSGRLPNEFYMRAVDLHLREYLPDVLEAVESVLALDQQKGKAPAITGVGIILRGLLERARYARSSLWRSLHRNRKFNELYRWYQDSQFELLLDLEKQGDIRGVPKRFNPGLAASVGWCLYKLFTHEERGKVHAPVHAWFSTSLQSLISTFQRQAAPSPAHDASWDAVAAFYSTFLQWAIRTSPTVGQTDPVEDVSNVPKTYRREIAIGLQVILEDELLWAILEKGYDLRALTTEVCAALKDTSEVTAWDEQKKLRMANLFLTLAWHNKWMDMDGPEQQPQQGKHSGSRVPTLKGTSYWREFAELAQYWFECRTGPDRDNLLEVIRLQTDLLDINLQYHWCHFLTQRALWMRDWCLEESPVDYERSQIAEGSTKRNNNRWLAEIATAIIRDKAACPKAVRNVLLLVGTRWNRFPADLASGTFSLVSFEEITRAVDSLILSAGIRRGEFLKYVLQAIFELSRQGFFAPWVRERPLKLHAWCNQTMNRASEDELGEAWQAYLAELKSVTHPLDLVPPERDGWRNIQSELLSVLS